MDSRDRETLPKINSSRVVIDGRRILLGPPPFYKGPRPPIACELYITNLPSNLSVSNFFAWLNRCGPVFESRLMMTENQETRGYGFVRFFQKETAIAAYELLSFLFLNGKRPTAQASLCKRQLFIANLPKIISVKDIRQDLNKLFPDLLNCKVYEPRIQENLEKNRGFAFLEFSEHEDALKAKRFFKTNRIWNNFVRVDWARPHMHGNVENSTGDLFIGLRKNDYCAKLRLYALANNWCIPIIVYGSNFKRHAVQYGAVLLKEHDTEQFCCVIVEAVDFAKVFDLHLLICEVATHLVECVCGMPQKHYIVRVRNGHTAKILFSFTETEDLTDFCRKMNAFISPISVTSLMISVELIALCRSETILSNYKKSFRTENAVNERVAMFCLIGGCPQSYFYSIYPKFRNNYPLNNSFNDTEIILLQYSATSDDISYLSAESMNELLTSKFPDEGAFILKSQRYNCHPEYVLNYVDLKLLKRIIFYHPTQQINTPALWLHGESYQTSIYEAT